MSEPKSKLHRLRFEALDQVRVVETPRSMVTKNDEWQRLVPWNMKPRQIGDPNGGGAARGNNPIDRFGAEPRHAQQFLAARCCQTGLQRQHFVKD